MLKKLIAITFLTISFLAQASDDYNYSAHIVHGPFSTKIYKNSKIYFSNSQEKNYPIYFLLDRKLAQESEIKIIDKYEVSGSSPKIETVFFYPIKKEENIIVLVSWEINNRGLGTYGTLYQLYLYKDQGGHLVRNEELMKNKEISGMDGYQEGNEISFKLKTASDIKKYIRERLDKP
ncbi:hypothetical protein [Pseudomonas citronellolis]|uniref:hypothetical protein n=1 Tax=Pseudomonas citronellolis TaxID=53408 RepID=UPI002FDB1A87